MSLRSWLRDGDGVNWPAVLLLTLALVVCGTTLVAASTSSSAFDPYNPAWDGTDDFRDVIETDEDVEGELVRETERYEEVPANETTAIIIAPEETYETEDAARVRQFVEDGGTVVVLENVEPNANDLLDDVGADARTDGRLVLDQRNYEHGPAMPIATAVANHSRTAGIEQLSLNYATAVEPNNATVLVATSDYAHLGETADAELDDEAVLDSYPVATTEAVGDGEVVVVGDPSIAINVMYGEPDNAAFLQRQYAEDEQVLFDVSHTADLPPLAGALLTLRNWPALQALVGLLAIATVIGTTRRPPGATLERIRLRLSRAQGEGGRSGERGRLSDTERAAALRESHPDWDEERIQRVITALNRSRSKRSD
ncbi:DUF4350 domain-containing protein [Natronococcus pandeyae]|uniref:DUF4350 domain-containing protein n=1 Tax=Natronococcus pandeyae TaxID=2055836 RepID=A0A8J8Q3E9_9EURY|nr:DUF4350 domain-containing protein [Natronococcus pandeyae]TYL37858.1 DUF4350 domain-containing protein [Natronococcus pandeyae]